MTIIHHDITSADAQAMAQMRAMFAGNPKLALEPATRPVFDDIIGQAPAPERVRFEKGEVGGVPGWWARPENAAAVSVILYLHGGGYVIGSAGAYRNFVGHIARRAGAAAFIANYALAPERPFPAAVQDVNALLDDLVVRDFARIAVVGDSAGGGLALASIKADAEKTGKIVGIVAMSPWIDMTLSGNSFVNRAEADPLLSRETLAAAASVYLGQAASHDDRLPSLDMDLSAMPPVRIHTGNDEVLLDDTVRFSVQAAAAGIDSEVHVWEGITHVFPASFAMLEAGASALEDIGAFLAEKLIPSASKKV